MPRTSFGMNQHSIFYLGWVFIYELSGCRFESRCCHLKRVFQENKASRFDVLCFLVFALLAYYRRNSLLAYLKLPYLKGLKNDGNKAYPVWNVSVFGVFTVRIFPHLDWIWRFTLNTDTFDTQWITLQKNIYQHIAN